MILVIPGEPVAKGRPKFSTQGGFVRAITPEKTINYENLVKLMYQQQCTDHIPFPKDVQLRADIEAYFSIPKSVSKKKMSDMKQHILNPTKKPDADNIAKSVLDSLNGIAYYDDSQIVVLTVKKLYNEYPKVILSIEEI